MSDKNRDVICIIGAHRSGTSMISMLLNRCGMYLGKDKDILGANNSNVMGHYENLRFMEINDALLNHFGGSWDKPPQFNKGWENAPELDFIYKKARSCVNHFPTNRRWGWKEPRTTLFIPFWRRVIPNLRFVICIRDPLEVVKSLYNRDTIPIIKGVILWRSYMDAAISGTERESRIFLFYEDFLNNPIRETERLLEFCGFPWPNDDSLLSDTIYKELKHHTCRLAELLTEEAIPIKHKLYYLGIRAILKSDLFEPNIDRAVESVKSENMSKFFHLMEGYHNTAETSRLESLLLKREGNIERLKRQIKEKDELIHRFRETFAYKLYCGLIKPWRRKT